MSARGAKNHHKYDTNDRFDPQMSGELPKQYDPSETEKSIYRRWIEAGAFKAIPDDREERYVVMMPLPNVTGALHLGHAMDNVMQDLLIRWHRMAGENTLWQPGTDHAGIATQAVVEKRLFELEGKTRNDVGREGLVQLILDWKEQYQARIIEQQQHMGCSCDWDRQRFTMDAVCERAVLWTFFNMFRDGLIYRGNRLVNWDCHLQTAVSDDEIVYESIQGHFWHIRYPIIDAKAGEPEYLTLATTRPETMLGDTAVACHPDPEGALEKLIRETAAKLEVASERDRAAIAADLQRLEKRRETHLSGLVQLAAMARDGRHVMLPLQNRPIPLVCDEWANPGLGSGCVKITPGHDPNDYDVWTRHADQIGIVNILEPDGTLNENAGAYRGLDRFEARKKVVADLEAAGLLDAVEDREVEIGHSDRSKTPIEPYLSKQWFVITDDVDGGIVFGRGTEKEFRAPGLAQAAIDAGSGEWKSASGRRLRFHPDPERYANTYLNWLGEKRDWCISRQLWWGHRIPIWWGAFSGEELARAFASVQPHLGREDVFARVSRDDGTSQILGEKDTPESLGVADETVELQVGIREASEASDVADALRSAGLEQDPDVLDSWFSSGLWPLSTLGWPDPSSAQTGEGQTPLGQVDGRPDSVSYYYPGSCLVTGRDIITLWVVRMQMMGLYCVGDVPFTDCFIHANILDGKGERMSKSKGNGIDPVDIIERYGTDAMRYVICDMQTGMQDIRLPVQAISPFTGKTVDLATAKHGRSIFTYLCPETKKEFDVLGTMDDVPSAKLQSDRFEVGRNFCNKLWNAARFSFMNLQEVTFAPRSRDELALEDRWILSRLLHAIETVTRSLESYNPAAAIGAAREFFWGDLCDWYLELVKPRMQDTDAAPMARQVLATVFDQILRLLHPFVPFITEALWARLGEQAPERGIDRAMETGDLLIGAAWPSPDLSWRDETLERDFEFLEEIVRAVRDVRSKYSVAPSARVEARIRARGADAEILQRLSGLLGHAAGIEPLEIAGDVERSRDAAVRVVGDVEIYVPGVVDPEKEKAKLAKQRDQIVKRLDGAKRKLSNENFVSRAAPDVVERERGRLQELESELQNVETNLASLD